MLSGAALCLHIVRMRGYRARPDTNYAYHHRLGIFAQLYLFGALGKNPHDRTPSSYYLGRGATA